MTRSIQSSTLKVLGATLYYERQGQGPLEHDGPPPEMPEPDETFLRVSGNFEYWLAHGMTPLTVYVPDVAALRRGKPRIVVAIGQASAGLPIAGMAAALATKLEVAPVIFPGDHMAFEVEAAAFAAALDRAFSPS